MQMSEQIFAVDQAFSRQSEIFDKIDADNSVLAWMRKRVRDHVLEILNPGDKILEINSGTGLDAFYFHSKGFTVHATDVSHGMISVLQQKIQNANVEQGIKAARISYTELDKLTSIYNFIFSNFGGLNCTQEPEFVIRQFDKLLEPGGRVTLVIMPKISPWEIFTLLKGNFKMAFRRFKRNGAESSIEGVHFTTWYFSPKRIIKAFGNNYKLLSCFGLGIVVPSPHHVNFGIKYPVLFRFLVNIEKIISGIPFLRGTADHFVISLEYQPDKIIN
jgi:ubiquinone/menaquinone biosynthesis C-methylase UbiE